MKTNTHSVCAALVVAALSCIVPETAHAIQGDPIPGVDVSIEQSPGGIIIASDSSNGDGNASFNGITAGTYVVHVTLPPYQSNNYNSAKLNTAGIVMAGTGWGFPPTVSKTVFEKVVPYVERKTYSKQIVIPPGPPLDFTLSFSLHVPSPPTYVWSTLAGGTQASFVYPRGVAVDASGNCYLSEQTGHIRKVTSGGDVTTFAGGGNGDGLLDGTGSAALFHHPTGIAIDSSGNLYVADSSNFAIRKVTPSGVVTTLAGGGPTGSVDGTGASAHFGTLEGVAVDSGSNVYVADAGNNTIRKVTPDGVVTTLAGLAGSAGSADGTGGAARFNYPRGLALDANGNLYVTEYDNHDIRMVTPAGDVTTLAGSAGIRGSADGTGSAAQFDSPWGIVVNANGNILVADTHNYTIREVTPAGVVTTLAGSSSTSGYVDGPSSVARFSLPGAMAKDAGGSLYLADIGHADIRKGTLITDVNISTEVTPLFGGSVTGGGNYTTGDSVNLAATPNAGYVFAGWTSGTSLVSGSANYSFTAITNQSLVANFAVPSVFTDAATDVSFASATLNGHLGAGGTVTSPRFQWGTTTAYGQSTPATANQASLTGLTINTTYHYRFVAEVDGFTQYGDDVSFAMLHNDAPIAVDDLYYFPTNPGPQTLNVLTNDSDPDGGTLHIVGVSQATGGRVAIVSGSTALLYTPSSRYSGNDSFSYKISDGFGGTSTATVRIRNPYLNFEGTFQTLLTNGDPAHDGYVTVTLLKAGSLSGSLKTMTGTYSLKGSMDATGHATIIIPRTGTTSLTVTLAMDFDGGGFTASVNDGTPTRAPTGNFTAKVPYTATNPAPQSGKFTMLIPPPAQTGTTQATASATVTNGRITGITMTNNGAGYISQPVIKITGTGGVGASATAVLSNGQITGINVGAAGGRYPSGSTTVTIDPPSGLPQGIGWATVTVLPTGGITIIGQLCDGQAFSAGSFVDANWSARYLPYAGAQQSFPIFASVYSSPAGRIYGTFNFSDEPNVSDFDGTLNWWKPAQTTAGIFRGGFTLAPMAIGSTYTPPTAGDFILDLDAPPANALVTLNDGNLSGEISKNVSISAATTVAATSNLVTVDTPGADALKLTIVGTTGKFTGSFTRTINGVASTPAFSGVLFQKQNIGGGVFVGPSQSGSVLIWPPVIETRIIG